MLVFSRALGMQIGLKKTLVFIILFGSFGMLQLHSALAQRNVRREIRIPDIPGHRTQKCDFHSRTVFSDGSVWPGFFEN
jgi:UPF0716 family protein affecting phage T7 exclusion